MGPLSALLTVALITTPVVPKAAAVPEAPAPEQTEPDIPIRVLEATPAPTPALAPSKLGPGWWVSDTKMVALGTKIRDCDASPGEQVIIEGPSLLPFGFWAGVAVGAVLTGAAAVAVVRLLPR